MLKDSGPSVVLSALRDWAKEQDPELLVVQEPVREPEEKSLASTPVPVSEK